MLADRLGDGVGPGFSGASGCGLGWLDIDTMVVAVELDIRGPDTEAARRGTMGSKGSIGEYCVAASTATYCFGRERDGDRRAAEGEERDSEGLDWRRGKGTVILGDWRGEREVA